MRPCKWCTKQFEPRFQQGKGGRGRPQLFCSDKCRRHDYNARRPSDPTGQRTRYIRRTYNLTPEQWDALFESQGRRCALCRSPDPKSKKGWCVDHDHVTGKVRGILCHKCNLDLGAYELLKSNPAVEEYLICPPLEKFERSNTEQNETPSKIGN